MMASQDCSMAVSLLLRKAELRYVSTIHMAPFVMIVGMSWMLELYVPSLATMVCQTVEFTSENNNTS